MQVGSAAMYQGHYRLSYLMSLLLWPEPAVLLLPEAVHQAVRLDYIPRLQAWMPTHKPVYWGNSWPHAAFEGLLITTPEVWLQDRLQQCDRFPVGIPVFIDGADDLESWLQSCLTVTLDASAWQSLRQAYPQHSDMIQDAHVHLTYSVFQHPPNPYHCHLLDAPERHFLLDLEKLLVVHPATTASHPSPWNTFWEQARHPESLLWANLNRDAGHWVLNCSPLDVASSFRAHWTAQPLVIMGGALDTSAEALTYRQRLGLGDMTCLKFNPDRQTEEIQLYLPDRIPFPNTPEFQPVLLEEVGSLVLANAHRPGLTIVLVNDTPLKQQVASMLAAQFGSRLQVETTYVDDQGILVCGWQYWRTHASELPLPTLLVIATLPLPSLENPLVAGQVAYYKRSRQDWFRLYLLPMALNELQRAIAPLRVNQSIVALLDNRVNHRSYGRQILDGLTPAVHCHQRHSLWLADPAIIPPGRPHY
jgi:ATP-dependent DNA helicase DinG